MNYKDFTLGDWIGHISGVIEDETTLDGNEMRDLVEFLTTLNQQPCDDCISRRATVERLCRVADFMNEKRKGLGSPYIMAALFIQDNKDEFPSVAPKERTAYWIYKDLKGQFCSACDKQSVWKFNYCPNCGARMIEPQKSEG